MRTTKNLYPSQDEAINHLIRRSFSVCKTAGEVVAVRKTIIPTLSLLAQVAPDGDGFRVTVSHTRLH